MTMEYGSSRTADAQSNGRLASLDALRGFDMFFIMGFATLVMNLCVAFGWGKDCWLAVQMTHPPWIGLTQHDTIFPLFIFMAGLSFPFSMAKQLANGRTKWQVALRVLRRAATLFLLGMVFEKFFQGQQFRFGSVLGRIGIAWALAAWAYLALGVRARAALAVAVLLGYWALNLFVAAPDNPSAGVFTPQGNIVCWFDRMTLARIGRISPGTEALPFDNQSLLSNLTAMVTAMLGMFTGEFVRGTREKMSGNRRAVILFGAAAALVALGALIAGGFGRWSFPLSKPLWSPSFTLIVGGYSVAMFALFHWLIDVKGWWRHTLFFRVIGLNSITIYLARPLLNLDGASRMLFGRFADLFPEPWAAVVSAAAIIGTCWCFLYFLHSRRIYFKV